MRSVKYIALFLFLLSISSSGGTAQEMTLRIPEKDEWLFDIIKNASEKYKIPGVSAAVLTGNGLESIASYGVRKYKTNDEVTDNDLWHLGSNTKMMTASLAAICIDRGFIRWDTTVHEVFNDILAVHPEYKDVTLLALLSHRGGLNRPGFAGDPFS